jgi:uncharacterized protein YkwD
MPNHRLAARAAVTVAAALCAAALSTPAVAAPPCPGADALPTATGLAGAQSATLCLLNRERRLHGLRPLRADAQLRAAARSYAGVMVRHAFFAHVSPGGSTLLGRVRQTAYPLDRPGWLLGENIAWGSGELATPAEIVDAWMHSAGHRHNILTARFAHIGIGIAPGAPVRRPPGPAAATYVTDFGTV